LALVRVHLDQQDEAGRPAREPGKAPGAQRRRGPEPRGCPREVIGRAVAAAGGPDSPPRPRRPPPPFFFGSSNFPLGARERGRAARLPAGGPSHVPGLRPAQALAAGSFFFFGFSALAAA